MAVIAAFLMLAASRLASAETVGVRQIEVFAPERQAPLAVSVWYPTTDRGDKVDFGGNAVFYGSPAVRDAAVAGGRSPLIVISHGGFRAAPNLANWLASALAAEGYVAAAVYPPALADGPATPAALAELWLRPADLSATITAVEQAPEFSGRIETARVGAVGFFLGAAAVMSLAGARIDPAEFARLCEVPGIPDCAWFAEGGVDLHHIDARLLSRSNRDPRLTAAIAVDPEFTGTLTVESLRSIPIPISIISVGPTDAAGFASRIPDASHTRIDAAGPFSSFPECKPTARAILESEGGAEVCDGGGERSRAAIHAELIAAIVSALRGAVGPR